MIPRIFTPEAPGVVAFMREVFDAEGEIVGDAPADMRLRDSLVMVSTGGGARPPMAAALYVYVPDVDEAFRRAVAIGAEIEASVQDQTFGDRVGIVRDPFGNVWQIATALSGEEPR